MQEGDHSNEQPLLQNNSLKAKRSTKAKRGGGGG